MNPTSYQKAKRLDLETQRLIYVSFKYAWFTMYMWAL